MTLQPPDLFDTDLLALRRSRAKRIGPADFLHEAVALEVSERLKEINRTFRDAVVIGHRAEIWAGALGDVGAMCADTPILDLAPEAHDLAIHALALHWANDPVGQLIQVRRALRPDGLFIGALFGGETLHELRAALAEAEIAELGGLSPRVAPFGEIRDLGGLLQRGGFALPVADSVRFDTTYSDPISLMHDLRAMGETNVMRDRLRRPTPRRVMARATATYVARHAGSDGRIPATFEVVFLTGWAPSANQQRPQRPGTAKVRLADALGVNERRPTVPE